MENLKELESMYNLRYLESGVYYFGWAHATDVRVPPDASEKTKQDFWDLEKEFDTVIGSFTMKPDDGQAGEFSLMADNRPIKLKSWYTEADLSAFLGKPVRVNEEVLGSGSDTYSGCHKKTLKYEGLVVKLFSPKDNGKEFWLMSVDLTSSKLKTPRGITVGSTLAQLKEAYKGIEIIPDGRTDANICAYRVGGSEIFENITFEVEKGIVKEIKLFVGNYSATQNYFLKRRLNRKIVLDSVLQI
ncbi:MAG: hypothetical protein WC364_11600, partial [Eubacteriales bacterium]